MFCATAAEMGFSELTIAGAARPFSARNRRYAHMPDSALAAAADRVCARITAALDGRDNLESQQTDA